MSLRRHLLLLALAMALAATSAAEPGAVAPATECCKKPVSRLSMLTTARANSPSQPTASATPAPPPAAPQSAPSATPLAQKH